MTIPFARYLNIREAYNPSFSPDRKRLSVLTNITGVPQVWVIDVSGGWPDQITFYDERILQAHFSPVADQLAFSRDVGGNENAQIYLINGNGSGERRLTHSDDVMHIFGNWSRDGQYIAYTANQRDSSKFDVYIQNVENGESELVWENNYLGFLNVADFSADGSRLLIHLMQNSMDNDLFEIDIKSKTIRKLTEHAGDVRYLSPVYSHYGKSVYCACDQDRDFATLARIDLSDLPHHFLEETPNEIEYIAASPNGQWLLWVTNVEGANQFN